MDLQTAALQSDLDIVIRGIGPGDGDLTGRDMVIRITNRKKEEVTITADPGFILESMDGDVQDMIITEPLEMLVRGGSNKAFSSHAMCIQLRNKSPLQEHHFRPGRYADGNMKTLASFLHQHHYQDHRGQDAMWVLSDQRSVYEISGPSGQADHLRRFVAELAGVEFDSSLVKEGYHIIPRAIKQYALHLTFFLDRQEDIHLKLYNQKGEFEHDLMDYPQQAAGRYDMHYKVSLSGAVGDKYYVRLYVGDDMRKEFTLLVKDS